MDLKPVIEAALAVGFTHAVPMDPATIELKSEVRDMCANCKIYGKRWSCPPACGTLEDCAKVIASCSTGILVQTVGELEDELDGEAMMDTQDAHKENFRKLMDELVPKYPGMISLGAGACNQCKECTYPDAPCRMPEKMVSSMEAYGMVVLEVCKANNQPYYYGPCTIAYTSCFLFP